MLKIKEERILTKPSSHTIIRLPQPGTAPRPDRATSLAQCTGTMMKKSVNGAPLLQDGVSWKKSRLILLHINMSRPPDTNLILGESHL